MSMYGANPEQLTQLGATLKRQIDAITSVMSTVTSVLNNTTWVGPAHDQFQADWDGSFVKALTQLNQAFDLAGQDCLNRSTDLQRVMGAR
jgi:uncharacterized protein YukE